MLEDMIKQHQQPKPKITENRKIKINSWPCIKNICWHHRKVQFHEKKQKLYIKHLKDIDVEDLNDYNTEEFIELLQKPKKPHHIQTSHSLDANQIQPSARKDLNS